MNTTALNKREKPHLIFRIPIFITKAIFWFWKIAFLIIAMFIFLPEVIPMMWSELNNGHIPIHYFALGISIMLLPMIGFLVTLWVTFKNPQGVKHSALNLFYGFELPTLLLLIVYLFNLRDYHASVYWILGCAIVGFVTWFYLALMMHHRNSAVPFPRSTLAMAGSTVLFVIGIFSSVLVLLFVIPLSVEVVKYVLEIVQNPENYGLKRFWQSVSSFAAIGWYAIPVAAMFVFFGTSALLLISFPFIAIYLYIKQFFQRLISFPSGLKVFTAVTVIVLIPSVHFFAAEQQPQQEMFKRLNQDSFSTEEKKALLEDLPNIKKALLNAYLGQYRYMSSSHTANVLARMYERNFSLSAEHAEIPQTLLNTMVQPLLYDGNAKKDVITATQLYERVFDAPIQKSEQSEILRTVAFNWEIGLGNSAGLLDVSEEKVYLASQTVDVTTVDQLATITFTQKLLNQTDRQLEAVVHFSLPEHAVMTGVWLSHSESDPEEYSFLVSPRGAAQAVYNAEVNRRIDPALLEQVGPEQYRLRVYPIPRNLTRRSRVETSVKPMFVRVQYQTLANENGEWPLPSVLERRNIYWDQDTQDTLNGQLTPRQNKGDWLPAAVAQLNTVTPSVFNFGIPNGQQAWAVPRMETALAQETTHSPLSDEIKKRSSIVIDGSRSMETQQASIAAVLEQFPTSPLYFCQLQCEAIQHEELSQQVYFGNTSTLNHLNALSKVDNFNLGDQVLLLTDSGSYELEDDSTQATLVESPVWVLHLGGKQPNAYPDQLLQAVRQSGGGFGHRGIEELWPRMLTQENLDRRQHLSKTVQSAFPSLQNSEFIGASSSWAWFLEPAAAPSLERSSQTNLEQNLVEATPTLAALAASLEISHTARTNKPVLSKPETALTLLSQLHEIASDTGIVTEFSSMIVLVNDRQKEALKEAEQQDDRFDREIESGKKATSVPMDSLSVPAVPEPREWAMFIVVLIFLTVSYVRRHGLSVHALLDGLKRQH